MIFTFLELSEQLTVDSDHRHYFVGVCGKLRQTPRHSIESNKEDMFAGRQVTRLHRIQKIQMFHSQV